MIKEFVEMNPKFEVIKLDDNYWGVHRVWDTGARFVVARDLDENTARQFAVAPKMFDLMHTLKTLTGLRYEAYCDCEGSTCVHCLLDVQVADIIESVKSSQ